ncbi:hypothetical protein [Marinobacter nauticus]|uniref:Peptide ABC transporter substrate-binding protein n=1 Tax=Marinobacter nauticus TaxID=2743 RepID=A0A368UL35_MARNT|nr:hypothetical protein [Marinobacter nauticus]MCG8521531.1 hypothetical protein [Pseudomonadales bacterium]MBN8238547.1 hypothetical protein [Marinobacter nauticus]MBY6222764.1 hypothetical protein [Marinobacter nauticus]RBP68445.1 hypothetical protein DET64_1264 [Marinobacter nauticus]RCW29343.1 hypothetical protein DET51_1264 [Marinobacter nauticus]
MKESDWKKFKVIKERAIERFCTQALDEFGEVISNTDEHVHNRYLLLYKLVQNRDKEMSLIFDDHSRSNAPMQLTAIRAKGLADESLLAELSDEFREQTDPKRFGWE